MSFRKLKAGTTSQAVPVFVRDTSSTTGAGLGALAFNTAGLTAKYRREGQSSWTAITLATATLGTWTSGGFITDGGVSGGYEVGIPDAVLAAGAKWAQVQLYGAANMLPVNLLFELDTIDYQASGGKVPVQQLAAADFATAAIARAAFAADTGLQSARSGTAQAGASGSITLDASASATTDFYKGQRAYLTGGTGAGQDRLVTGYNGSTKVAAIAPAWATNPDNTSTFAVVPNGQSDVETVTGAAVSCPGTAGVMSVDVANWKGGTVPSPSQSGVPVIDLKYILGAAVTQGASGRLAGAFTTFFNVSAPTLTAAGVDQTGDSFARLGVPVGASVSADIAAKPTAAANAAALLATALTQHNASALTTSTVEDALSAARAQGAGAWTLVGTTLTLKNPDGTTFRSFTLDSSSVPTSRT